MRREWSLPNGTKVQTDGGAIGIKFKGREDWICLAPTLADSEDLLAVLNLDVARARDAVRRAEGGR